MVAPSFWNACRPLGRLTGADSARLDFICCGLSQRQDADKRRLKARNREGEEKETIIFDVEIRMSNGLKPWVEEGRGKTCSSLHEVLADNVVVFRFTCPLKTIHERLVSFFAPRCLQKRWFSRKAPAHQNETGGELAVAFGFDFSCFSVRSLDLCRKG